MGLLGVPLLALFFLVFGVVERVRLGRLRRLLLAAPQAEAPLVAWLAADGTWRSHDGALTLTAPLRLWSGAPSARRGGRPPIGSRVELHGVTAPTADGYRRAGALEVAPLAGRVNGSGVIDGFRGDRSTIARLLARCERSAAAMWTTALFLLVVTLCVGSCAALLALRVVDCDP